MPLYILIFLLYQISPANAETQCGNLCNKNWWKQNNLILLQKELSLAEIDLTSNLDENAPIYFASAYGSPEMLKYLIENGADANQSTKNGFTPLHAAVEFSDITNMNILIEHGANVNAKSIFGFTPLHRAATERGSDVVLFLIKNGADASIIDNLGTTPYYWGQKNKKLKLTPALKLLEQLQNL